MGSKRNDAQRSAESEKKKTQKTKNKIENKKDTKLFKQYKYDGNESARDELILRQENVVHKLAYKHSRWKNSCSVSDLIQEGWIGVMRAVEKYDDTLGVPFNYYVHKWCEARISKHIYTTGRTIRTPIMSARGMSKVDKSIEKLKDQLNREPLIAEISEDTGYTIDQVRKLIKNKVNMFSLFTPLSSQESDVNYMSMACDEQQTTSAENVEIADLVNWCDEFMKYDLNVVERHILAERFGLNGHTTRTLSEIGKKIGRTKQGVRSIEKRALTKLRDQFDNLELQEENNVEES